MIVLSCSSGDKSTAAAPAFVFTAPLKQQMTTDVSASVQREDQIEKAALGVSDITFVSESQPQSNSSKKKKPRRRKAPIYWGKRPSKRKSGVKRKLDSALDQVTEEKECVENGEHAEITNKGFPENSGDKSADEEAEKVPDVNCDVEDDVGDFQEEGDEVEVEEEEEEDDVELMENGVASVNGDVVLLDPDNVTAELNNGELNSGAVLQNDLGYISQLTERTLKNHDMLRKLSSLHNGITADACSEDAVLENECDVELVGETGLNK